MDLTVIFATYKSEAILEKSLQAYCAIETNYQWELIVVDNADRKETRDLVNRYIDKLPLTFVEKSLPGKNNALNKAIPLAKSELIWFTDNDIMPNSNLINKYVEAANQYSEVNVFGGNIIPDIQLPNWIDTSSPVIRIAFGILDLGTENKVVEPKTFWGGNMLLRKAVFNKALGFNGTACPHGNNHIMGNETELLLRLQDAGEQGLYIANNAVLHQIRDEQLTVWWLFKRAYNAGCGAAHIQKTDNVVTILGVPRYLLPMQLKSLLVLLIKILTFNKSRICLALMKVSNTYGRIKQFYEDTLRAK